MIKSLRNRGGALLAVILLALSGFAGVAAQQGQSKTANGFQISPVRSEYTIPKGKNDTLTISITNPSDVPVTAKAVVNDFVASDDETGTPRLILDEKAPAPKNDFKKLVGNLPDVDLAGKERKDVPVKITVPADANAGGYYGAIRFVPANASQASNIGLTASVGSIVLVTVPGNLTERLDIVQLSAEQNNKARSFFNSGDVSVLVRIKNSGDIHEKPYGRVNVKDMFGKTVTSYEFNNTEPKANILPDSIRRFDNQLPKHSWLGRYTIEANLGYSQGGGNIVAAKAAFWFFPAWSIVIIVLVLVTIAALIYLLLKRRDNRLRRRPQS